MKGTLFLTFTESIGKLQLPKVFFHTLVHIYLHLVSFYGINVGIQNRWSVMFVVQATFLHRWSVRTLQEWHPRCGNGNFSGVGDETVRFSWWRACAIRISSFSIHMLKEAMRAAPLGSHPNICDFWSSNVWGYNFCFFCWLFKLPFLIAFFCCCWLFKVLLIFRLFLRTYFSFK